MVFSEGSEINGRYRIIKPLGVGGFGEVYRAEDNVSHNTVALKCVLPQAFEGIPDFADLFVREAKAAQKVLHDNVVRILSIEETRISDSAIPFFTMECAPNGDLDNYIRHQDGFLSIDQLIAWMNQLLSGLRAVNAKIIHRDIKPKNILIFSNVLKISDFGICKFIEQSTRTMTFKGYGTAEFMAPEVWENVSATTKVDIYSMGIVFYILATLKHPFLPVPIGESRAEYLKQKHLYEIPKKPTDINSQLPDKLSLMIMKMIEKRPENRFSDANEILAYLDKSALTISSPPSKEVRAIADLLHRTEESAKKLELEKNQTLRREREKAEKAQRNFILSCEDLIMKYDQIVNSVNTEASTVRIEKHLAKSNTRYELTYSFHRKSIKIVLEMTDSITQVKNVIAWGFCYVDEYQDGFNLLLQLDPQEIYPKWVITRTRDQATGNPRLRYFDPHAMLDVPRLDDALHGLSATHVYQSELKPFSLDCFIELVKKLASGRGSEN